MTKEGLKGIGTLGCLVFPFTYVIILSVSSWLMQRSNTGEKGQDRVLWYFTFLRMLLLAFISQSKFWFKWKVWLLG